MKHSGKLLKVVVHRPDLLKPRPRPKVAKSPPRVVREASPTTPAAPDLKQLASNLNGAWDSLVAHAKEHGLSRAVVSRETFDRRLNEGCRKCPMNYWKEDGLVARCLHPKCGCSKLKHWLASQSCPLDPPMWRAEQ